VGRPVRFGRRFGRRLGLRLGLPGLLFAAGCASTQPWQPPSTLDSHDVPEELRPGYGNAELHTWWPLTPAEVVALRGVERARRGDASALLALAILASGDRRDPASYTGYQQRVDRFLSGVRPVVAAAPDPWHRGYELHRAMHRAFFGGERSELGSYELEQARVTGIFDRGRYNCLSSAMLFAVLARGLELPVRAAILPTHVFVEMGEPGGKVIEVETTSATGFDWVHDARFYVEEASGWSGRRGLRPATIEEYRQREIVEPYRLMATAMRGWHADESEADRYRRYELAALIDPDDAEAQRLRVQTYANEAHDLYDARAWRTTVKLFETVRPALLEIRGRSRDPKTTELVSWSGWYHAKALMVVGRSDEAVALAAESLTVLDAAWPDAGKLKHNYTGVLSDRLGELMLKKDYGTAVKVFSAHRDACRSSETCAGNAGVVYGNWSIEHQNAGDWQSARQVLRECVTELPNDSRCRDALTDLESRHRF
jgi:hypothetical protein